MRKHLLFIFFHVSLVSGLMKRRNLTEIIEKLRIGKESFDSAKSLHYMWHTHSVKALLVQVAKGIVPLLDQDSERSFLLCLKRIKMKTDLVSTSKCLVNAKNTLRLRRHDSKTTVSPAFFVDTEKNNQMTVNNIGDPFTKRRLRVLHINKLRKQSTWKTRRRLLLIRHIRFFTNHRREADHRRVKRSEYRLIPKGSNALNRYIKRLKNAPNLLDPRGSPVQQLTKTVTKLFRKESSNSSTPRWADTYRSILKIKRDMESREKDTTARMYDSPVDELVFNKTLHESRVHVDIPLQEGMPPLVKDALSLANSLRSHTTHTREDPNYKMLSPRFAPVLPDKYDGRGLLSPSVLAFYKDDAEEQIVPLPSLLEATGMERKDRDSLLEMIMEISGARDTVQEAAKVLQQMNLFGIEGELVEVTKRITQVFTEMANTFTKRQKDEIEKRKFTFLEKDQLKEVYAKQGLKREHHEDFDLDEYDRLSYEEREEALWKKIELIAANETVQIRSKRQIPNVLSVLQPTVLSPYMFSPVYGFTLLGPAVLSPSLFSPLILNPALLSPYVFSPAVGMPFILSPYFLSPYVFSPLIMAPFILNPYVLSPNVLNPYVLSPLILSPLVICPDVLSPMVLGGAILSPGIASPAIFSKSTLMATVLSPTFLS